MKISIITATYNRASTIVRAISSVRSQTYDNVQLVIIDGGSTDKTIELIKPLMSTNDIVCSEQDYGIYDALNKGINISNGEIIAFLHSDDFYVDEEVVHNVIKLFKDDEVDIVYGDVSFFKGNNPKKVTRIYHSEELSKRNLAWGKMPAHPAMFIRRKVYTKVGNFKIDYQIAGDYEFLCRLVKDSDFKVKRLPKVLVRMQSGGASTKGMKSFFLLNREVYRALRENGIYTNYFMLFSKYFSKLRQFIVS